MKEKFIVAEITKNWINGESVTPKLLSQQFEMVINTNDNRGYKLVDWKYNQHTTDNTLIKTIIAVFKLKNVPKT